MKRQQPSGAENRAKKKAKEEAAKKQEGIMWKYVNLNPSTSTSTSQNVVATSGTDDGKTEAAVEEDRTDTKREAEAMNQGSTEIPTVNETEAVAEEASTSADTERQAEASNHRDDIEKTHDENLSL